MDLEQALRTVNTRLHLPGTSTATLAQQVRGLAAPAHLRIWPVDELDGGAVLRPADVLLALAVATRPRYEADVHDAHAQWALLRYLGVFDIDGRDIALSPAGRRIVGNQRRVFSEEMGIGFAVCLARRWSVIGTSTPGSVMVLDVDVLLDPAGGGAFLPAVTVGSRRPDYVLVNADAGQVRLALLECKGTKIRSYVPRQLAAASEQLADLRIDGVELPGLAVGSLLANDTVEYFAVQRQPDPTGSQGDSFPAHGDVLHPWTLEDLPAAASYWSDPFIVRAVDPFGSAAEARSRISAPREPGEVLAAPVLAASWGVLADLAGNDVAVRRWADAAERVVPRRPRPRDEFAAPDGSLIRGVSNIVTLPGGRLEVVLGVLDYIDDALSNGDSDDILRAQRTSAANRGRIQRAAEVDVSAGVIAHGDDGSVLLLRPG